MTDAIATDYAVTPEGRPRIVIRPPGSAYKPATPGSAPVGGDDWSDIGGDQPTSAPGQQPAAAAPDDWSDVANAQAPPLQPPQRQVGSGEAVARGAVDAASLGLAPIVAGNIEAATAAAPDGGKELLQPSTFFPEEPYGMQAVAQGIADRMGQHPDPAAQEAYERGRADFANDQKLAQEQHPWWYLLGQLTGSAIGPTAVAPGASGASLPTRLAIGAAGGAAGGQIYGTGEALGQGEALPAALRAGATDAVFGGLTGGALHGTFGPRVRRAPTTSGERAAQTASDLGAPLPRGVVSDRPIIQDTTAAAQSVPLTGTKITQGIKRTEGAAGEYVGDVADQMTRGVNDRAASDVIVRPGMQQVVQDNKDAIDAAYDGVRRQIDRNARFTMPRTGEAIDKVIEQRRRAGWKNPEEGLGDFMNIAISPAKSAALQRQAQALYTKAKAAAAMHPGAGAADKAKADELMTASRRGTTFEGAHRARSDAANKGNPAAPHPGYDAADFNYIRGAMKADLRHMLAAAAQAKGSNPQKVLAEFDRVERAFGPLKEANELLDRLVNAKGEGAISTLLGATKEKGGDFRLLLQLKNKMPPREFEQIGGMVLNELGANPSRVGGKEFSLAKFVTEWNKLSPRAKEILFDPQHLRNIEDIVGMGEHIKGALAKSNTSHTGGVFVLYELLNAGVEATIALGVGGMSPGQFAAATGAALAPMALAGFLSIPKNAASMAKFSRTWQAFTVNPTPARIGVLTAAARNMANTLGLDPAPVLKALQSRVQGALPGRAEENQGADQNQ